MLRFLSRRDLLSDGQARLSLTAATGPRTLQQHIHGQVERKSAKAR